MISKVTQGHRQCQPSTDSLSHRPEKYNTLIFSEKTEITLKVVQGHWGWANSCGL